MKKLLFASTAVIFALSTPAFADYYVVHGPDRHCKVVEHYEPADREIIRVGPLSFGTREDAEHQLKVICHDDGYYREEERVEEHREHERR